MSTREQVLENISVLDSSVDRDRIAAAAVHLAASGDEVAMTALRERLPYTKFLRQLDDLSSPQSKTSRLHRVLLAVQTNPGPGAIELGLALGDSTEFTSDMSRVNDVMPILAAERPMSDRVADMFRRTNEEGFYSINGPLLVCNRSPKALAVFEEMIADRSVEPPSRIYLLHWGVIPYRTDRAVSESCARLLDRGLGTEVENGVIEALFDYQEKPWYGTSRKMPVPPGWDTATSDALRFLRALAGRIAGRANLPPGLKEAVQASAEQIENVLSRRAA